MRLKTKYISINGDEFLSSIDAARNDHKLRVRALASAIVKKTWGDGNFPTSEVDTLCIYLLEMEKSGLDYIVEAITESRHDCERDIEEYTADWIE
jgi:hypothetical protein